MSGLRQASAANDAVALVVPGSPSLELLLQHIPRRDLDPRGAAPISVRRNVQDFLGLRDPVLGGTSVEGMWIWDNREHQYWRGYDGSFLPRHAPVDEFVMHTTDSRVEASLSYRCDGVVSRHTWTFFTGGEGPPRIDCRVRVTNERAEDLPGYSQLIANYHPPTGRAFYLRDHENVVSAPDHAFLAVGDAAAVRMAAIDAEWSRAPFLERAAAACPILVSSALWGNWRHVLLGDGHVWGLVTWGSDRFRALDCLIGPPGETLAAGESFTTTMRHVFVSGSLRAADLLALAPDLAGS